MHTKCQLFKYDRFAILNHMDTMCHVNDAKCICGVCMHIGRRVDCHIPLSCIEEDCTSSGISLAIHP